MSVGVDMDDEDVLVIESERESWRLECPRGHKSAAPTNNHWWCQRCASWPDTDPEYETIVDDLTGRELRREDVKFDYARGLHNEPAH